MPMYEVIVGNIGTVYSGEDALTAIDKFETYVAASKAKVGRASGEQVTVLQDDEIIAEYGPPGGAPDEG